MEFWIARDNYKLGLSENEPHLFYNDLWVADGEDLVVLNPNWFPEVTIENSPKRVKIELL